MTDLDSSSALVWKANADLKSISAEVKTATSKENLQVATAREIPTSGGLINPSASEVWISVAFNFKRTFPSHGGIFTDTWYNGGSPIRYTQRQIAVPTLNEFKITKDSDLINLKSDGVSVFRVNSNGDIYTSADGSINTGGADLAERYTSYEALMPGEVVVTDTANPQGVVRSGKPYQKNILGVVSTAPGFVAGAYTKDSFPIALIGRVPVKVSDENGPIRAGDYITSGSLPGYAMRAKQAGQVIGKALQDFDSSQSVECPTEYGARTAGARCGAVMMFVNFMDYMGTPIEVLMEEEGFAAGAVSTMPGLELAGADAAATSSEHSIIAPEENTGIVIARQDDNAKQWRILEFLKGIKDKAIPDIVSEVFTGRLAASMEVIAPRITSELTYTRTMEVETIIGTATSTSASSTANFVRIKGGIDVDGLADLRGGLRVDRIGERADALEILADVLFSGRPVFSSDTAGFARIEKGATSTRITFDRTYDTPPVVNVTLALHDSADASASSTPDIAPDTEVEEAFRAAFEKGIAYAVSRAGISGFTIMLDKPAASDFTFDWTAFAIKDAKTFVSSPITDALKALEEGRGLSESYDASAREDAAGETAQESSPDTAGGSGSNGMATTTQPEEKENKTNDEQAEASDSETLAPDDPSAVVDAPDRALDGAPDTTASAQQTEHEPTVPMLPVAEEHGSQAAPEAPSPEQEHGDI